MKTQNTESRCYRTGKHTVCRRVRASLSPDVLQAVVVKGLTCRIKAMIQFRSRSHDYTVLDQLLWESTDPNVNVEWLIV